MNEKTKNLIEQLKQSVFALDTFVCKSVENYDCKKCAFFATGVCAFDAMRIAFNKLEKENK